MPEYTPPLRITLREGRFTATGLDARNIWERFASGESQPATCGGTLTYRGTRTSGVNSIP